MSANPVRLELRQDCLLISTDTVTKRIIEVAVTVPDTPPRSDRLPLNIALVIDRSGSMGGEKLEFVKQAACHILDLLKERDQVAVVTFDDEVRLLSPSTCLFPVQREALKKQIKELRQGGSTALFNGWVHGANEVAVHLLPDGINRALLLTDGQANVGETRIEVLEHHAHELNQRGVSTSTFGVGVDFNHLLLEGTATHGGGHYYFIEHPKQIPDLFRQELGELLTITARKAFLEVAMPSGTSINLLGDLVHEPKGKRLRLPLGDLFSGEQRLFYLEALTPTSLHTDSLTFPVELNYVDREGESGIVQAEATFTYAGEAETKATRRDLGVRQRAALIKIATAESRALRLAETGDFTEAAAMIRKVVEKYAYLLDEAFVAEKLALAERIEKRALTAMEQKTRHDVAYKMRHTRR